MPLPWLLCAAGLILVGASLTSGCWSCSCDGPGDAGILPDAETCEAVERFRRPETTSVTVLWVIDNSGSMCEEQRALRNSVSTFINSLQSSATGEASFHMGVITTDTFDPGQSGRLQNTPVPTMMSWLCPSPPLPLDCTTGLPQPLPKWVDDSTMDIERVFGCLASVGTSGFGGETALGAVRMALSDNLLSDPSANGGFMVPNSLLAIIFLGDEDDCSVCSGNVCGPLPNLAANLDCSINRINELTPVSEFVSAVSGVSPDVVVAAIIGVDPDLYSTSCSNGVCDAPVSSGPIVADPGDKDMLVPICSEMELGSAAPAPRIEAFTRSFDDAREYSICDPDYGAEIAEIGDLLGTFLYSGCLQAVPCPGCDPSEPDCVPFQSCDGDDPVAERILVRATVTGITSELWPCVDYTIETDPSCVGEYRINFDPNGTGLQTIPPGAEVEIVFDFDNGDGCVGPRCRN